MSTHRQALIASVTKRLQDPEYALTVSQTLRRIHEDAFDRLLLDAVFQKDPREGAVDVYDAAVFAEVYGGTLSGQIAGCSIPLGHEPARDKAVEENNRLLGLLPEGFRAHFEGGLADNDGHLSWDFELGVHVTRILPDGAHENVKVWIDPGRAPLEVGTTSGSRTLRHIAQDGCLARWPYRSKNLLVLFNLKVKRYREEIANVVPCSCEGSSTR